VRPLSPQWMVMTCGFILLTLLFPMLAAGQQVVDLTWNASTSQVAGYNVYRSEVSGGPFTKINSSLDVNTNYTDSSVQPGYTYYYVTTAVNLEGQESVYSNQAQATIPTGGPGSEVGVYSFNGSGGGPSLPYAGLIVDNSGHLYGTTEFGGTYNQGTVFEVTANPDGNWTESVLYSFTGGQDGGQPSGGLMLDASGTLYGTTTLGGSQNCNLGCGAIFTLTPTSGGWTESLIYTFTGGSDGRAPYAGLVSDAQGTLYGTTLMGGNIGAGCSSGCGTVFSLSHSTGAWKENVLYAFAGGNDGESPYAGLTFDAAGNLDGTTYAGGTYGNGTVFRLTPDSSGNWTESVLYTFTGRRDGKHPLGGVVIDKAGNFYGTASKGGAQGYGVVFKLASTSHGAWQERVLHTFGNAPAATPVAGLVMDGSGSLYGTTMLGADLTSCGGGCGTLFKLSPASGGGWTFAVLHLFGRNMDGYHPSGRLTLDLAGNLYGTTQAGGADGAGLVFEIVP